MSLHEIFDPVVKNHFEKKYSGGSSGDTEVLIKTMAEGEQFSLESKTATKIAAKAFEDTKIFRADFPAITTIEQSAFSGCEFLTHINFPVVTEVCEQAFIRCNSLDEVILPMATTIRDNAFYNSYIEKVDLPMATSIGSRAFGMGHILRTVILRTTSTVCACATDSFYDTPILEGRGNIYVPSSMYEYYRAAYEPALEAEGAVGLFDIVFRKIEDYPEICGVA